MSENFSLYLDLQQLVVSDTIPEQEKIENWITTALLEEALSGKSEQSQKCLAGEIELTLRIVDKDEIQTLNKTYRHQDKATNVLSFPHEPFPFEVSAQARVPLLGDLLICHDIVVAEARQQHKTIENHWAHMVVHGVLHLKGYDHIEESEAQIMENLEVLILDKLNISNPYQ